MMHSCHTQTHISIPASIDPGSSASSVWLQDGRPGDRGSIPGRGERIFPVACVSRLSLGPTQPPIQWVPEVLSPGLKHGQGVTLTTHPHLVPKSRMSMSYTSSPSSASVVCSGTALALASTDTDPLVLVY
jgi:hypothetical protein